MNRQGFLKTLAALAALTLALAACDGDDAAELTTTSSLVGSTTAPAPDSTDPTGGESSTTTSTSLVGQSVDAYEIVSRESTADGETLYIVVPPGNYTDVDLENFVVDLVDDDDSVESAEIFDDGNALNAFLKDEADQTADDLALIDEHHLVSLIDSQTIAFRGPFADLGEQAIGS